MYNTGISNYVNHLKLGKHVCKKNFKILHVDDKNKKLNYLETLEINELTRGYTGLV